MPSQNQNHNNLFYSLTSSSLTAWCIGVASIVDSHFEADKFMASVEQTFTYPERIDFALIKEAASLIAEYRIYSYEESNSFATIPLFGGGLM